jgi:hypothetical protein
MVASLSPPNSTQQLLRRVGRETAPALVPSEEIDILRTTRTESGFLNVYASRHVWVAKVKEGGRLQAIPGSRQPTPQQAAAFVVAWYQARFGEDWRYAIGCRKRNYWKVKYSPRFRGWTVTVWANGRAVLVADEQDRDRPLLFRLRSEAVWYAKRRLPTRANGWAMWKPPGG